MLNMKYLFTNIEKLNVTPDLTSKRSDKTKRDKAKKSRPFLKHLHYFRGFAIFNIVIVHTWRLSQSNIAHSAADYVHYMNRIREILFHGSTIYFLFISGFLFHYLSQNLKKKKYYKAKFKNVISPYLIISLLIIALESISFENGRLVFESFFMDFMESVMMGTAQIQFWYIPFIVIVFIISPLLLYIPNKAFALLTAFTFFMPLMGTRTGTDVTVFQFIYFMPVYILGMFTSMKYQIFKKYIEKYKYLLLMIFILSTVTPLVIQTHAVPFFLDIDLLESFYYLQKLSVTYLILYLFIKYENLDNPVLDLLATYSFSIFFLHVLVYNATRRILYAPEVLQHMSGVMIIPYSIFCVLLVLFLTLGLCMFLKLIFQRKSKYIIGV